MIEWIIVGVAGVHCLVFSNLIFRFHRLQKNQEFSNSLTFSIIIPVRNERRNILQLLRSIEELDYHKDSFEVLVVDDSSSDNTLGILKDHVFSFTCRALSLGSSEMGKKAAIELGVNEAKNEIIVTTDGDCQVPKNWLSSFSAVFDDQTKMVVGPVKMSHSNFFGALQSFDFSVLIGYAASLVGMGVPSMSNGANLAYRKAIFKEVEGYKGNSQIPSGDDEFLLLKVVRKFPGSIRFLKNSAAVVSTTPKETFNTLLNQRVRWLSKWKLHKKGQIVLAVLAVLFDNLAMLAAVVGVVGGWLEPWVLVAFIPRMLVKGIFSAQVNKLLGGVTNWLAVAVYELVYPFYVLLLSFVSIFGHYTWKGRAY